MTIDESAEVVNLQRLYGIQRQACHDNPYPSLPYRRCHCVHTVEAETAGGVCINEATFHVAQEDLPFGGSGNSGLGKTHGPEGFRNFSNQKAVFSKGKIDLSEVLFPPFGTKLQKLLGKILIR